MHLIKINFASAILAPLVTRTDYQYSENKHIGGCTNQVHLYCDPTVFCKWFGKMHAEKFLKLSGSTVKDTKDRKAIYYSVVLVPQITFSLVLV